jgi:Protein of unknown function (DUF1059)
VDKVIGCHCGFEARSEHEEGLVAEVQRHASEAHGMPLSHDEALLLVFRAELNRDRASELPVTGNRPRTSDDVISDLEEEE